MISSSESLFLISIVEYHKNNPHISIDLCILLCYNIGINWEARQKNISEHGYTGDSEEGYVVTFSDCVETCGNDLSIIKNSIELKILLNLAASQAVAVFVE